MTAERKGRFEPKAPVQLDPPKSDPISSEYLAKCDGEHEGYPTYVAIKGTVFDVSRNPAYQLKGNYHVFAGKDASRALAKSSLKPEDVVAEWEDLPGDQKKVLEDWLTFFSKRYNVVGIVQGADGEHVDGIEPVQAGIKLEPVQAGIKLEPVQAGIKLEPVQAGIKLEPVQAGIKLEPVQAGIKSEPVQTGIKPEPVQAGIKLEPVQAGIKLEPVQAGIKLEPVEADIELVPVEADIKLEPAER